MRYGKASPAFWRSNAAAPNCTHSSTARTRSIRCCGRKPGNLAGWDWEFQSNSGVSAWVPRVSPSCMANWGGNRRRDPISPPCQRRRPSSKPAAEAICQTWLPRLASGDISAAVPATLDVRGLTRSGARVSGTLRCLGAADAAFVLAPTDDAWVIVDMAGAEVTVAPMWDRTRDVIDVRLKDATPVGILPDAAATRAALTRAMALAVAADSAGGARSITERTIAYMKTREQFGQPIAGFQALKHRAADLATKLAVADEMVRHAVQRTVTDEPDAELWTLLAKSEVTEACVFVTTDCVQLHGGVGFTWDFDPHIFLKRARLNEVLIMANTALRDQAAAALAAITTSGRSALELEL